MIRIVLILLGADFARKRWFILFSLSFIWCLIGITLIYDALNGVLLFPLLTLGYVLLLEGILTLIVSAGGLTLKTKLRYTKGLLFVLLAGLIIDPHSESDFVLAMLCGTMFLIGGCLQIVSAWLVRFQGWRMTLSMGIFQLVVATLFYAPYPIPYASTVPFAIAVSMIVGGINSMWLADRLRRLPLGRSILRLWMRSLPSAELLPELSKKSSAHTENRHLTVHVWTPVGTAKSAVVRRPVIDRYIAAVDAKGVISTGHAALEVDSNLYISLYPAEEIDRSPDQFTKLLRATAENDVAGRYLPSYPEEAAAWCESTAKITYRKFNQQQLNIFWEHYRRDNTYNLTNRNCSSTVTEALEAALEGVLGQGYKPWRTLAIALLSPELWIAGQLYHRASSMAWTPGLTRDYARALRIVTDPPPVAWITLLKLARRIRRSSY